jgi:pyruvate-ferredoxin/flavodoxin oxidoreductase
LDHVLASGRNVNILVVDTEAYSNTGGQQSKATPRGAIAKFASAGKPAAKKDLGMIAMSYRNVYVASVALGADENQTLKAFREAEAFEGVSIIQAYAPCIVHGINMMHMLKHQKAVVDSGRWLLYRFDPRRIEKGENPLQLDSKEPKLPVAEFMAMENRFAQLRKTDPARAEMLAQQAQADVDARWRYYKFLAEGNYLAK